MKKITIGMVATAIPFYVTAYLYIKLSGQRYSEIRGNVLAIYCVSLLAMAVCGVIMLIRRNRCYQKQKKG